METKLKNGGCAYLGHKLLREDPIAANTARSRPYQRLIIQTFAYGLYHQLRHGSQGKLDLSGVVQCRA
ncbi:hypothetical protein ACO22_03931 [Paracoccidioides brasiliensis]|uniref:Uncharacterized protein n=1 Tax=Paracoccidioides brasiliensis TaxID=121759 RepID=A0A1D2JEI9_PARBR|nr:hypothetical protein ACO22_03931 [Paracoccidioides brasiliensis]